MSSDLYEQIISDRGSFERMIARLPGFEGYLDRKARRTADRLLREHLADQLSQQVRRLARIETTLLDNGGFNLMSKTQSAKTKLQMFRDRIEAAAPGYSGFFEAIKIEANELEMLYAFDEMQVVYLDKIKTALDTLETAVNGKEGVEAAISALDAVTVEANNAFERRGDALLKLKISGSSSNSGGE
jgi:hypothetical protein